MNIIPAWKYAEIREKLSNRNAKILKIGIQEMLFYFEHNIVFSRYDEIYKKDFNSFLRLALKHPDFDIRKWTYHLLCFCQNNPDHLQLVEQCLKNISLELNENTENLTWIAAVCGAHLGTGDRFEAAIRPVKLQDYLTASQIRFAASTYQKAINQRIDHKTVRKAISSGDMLTAIWLTKIYANQFLPIGALSDYREKHGEISEEEMNELLRHPSAVVRKYAMWAFAQEKGHLATVTPYVPVKDAFSLEPGVRKWYFVKAFQDKNFLESNPDFIQEVQRQLRTLPVNDREGILIGSEKLGYSPALASLFCIWAGEPWENNEPLLLRLMRYIASHSEQNDDFYEITMRAVKNIDTIPEESVRSFLTNFFMSERRAKQMDKNGQTFNFNAPITNLQIGSNNAIYMNHEKEKEDLVQKLRQLTEDLHQQQSISDEKYQDLVAHINCELSMVQDTVSSIQDKAKWEQVLSLLNDLKQVQPKERHIKLGDGVSALADFITIASIPSLSPSIFSFVKHVIQFIKDLFA